MANIQEIIKSSGFINESKAILIEDCLTQLEGTFGIKSDGSFENISSLPNLKKFLKDYEIREKLEEYFNIQVSTGKKTIEIMSSIVKEYAFTYLNRFVALKMMEERKIIKQSFSRAFESNNFKFYLADNPEIEKIWKQGKVYESYERFLNWLFTDLSKDEEIKVLFDPENICSLLFPQEKTLRNLFEILNKDSLKDIWKEDEVIGWVYQYFIEDEKEKVFNKIYKEKKKLGLRDIPAATQIFTPKWIVKFLVENTLGRLWIRMHPNSKLREKMQYFVPNEQDNDLIPLKKVCDITLLDPACGTMHFGMYAFDIFYEMYLEEINNAGNDGWLKEVSVKDLNQIPQFIIEYNIYGIDIDLRAIQLSALSLYLKAKSINKNISLGKYNLTYTDIPPFSEDVLNKFVKELPVEHEITKKLLLQILPVFNKAYYLGSLLKIEELVESFVEKEKVTLEKIYQYDLFSDGKKTKQMELDLQIDRKIIWEDVKTEIREALFKFSESNKEKTGAFIAGESVKGINLIDALIKKHDIIVSNPPYSGKRNWPEYLSKDLKEIYEKKSGDLYTCFIDRCIDSVTFDGFLGLVTIHTFMFTSSNEEIRKRIIEETQIETLVHLGTKTEFEVANKTAQGFVMYALQKKIKDNSKRNGVYFRVVSEEDVEKQVAFLNGLKLLLNKSDNQYINYYIIDQSKLKIIPSWPFVYWISDGIRNLFSKKLLSDVAIARQGLATSDNFRFLRLWWEVDKNNIFFNCHDKEESLKSDKKWYPYMKGGEVRKWYGNQEYLINWKKDGKELKEWASYLYKSWSRIIKNVDLYYKEGATYSFLTISNLSVRFLPIGFIFDVAGSTIYPQKIDNIVLIGLLNSKLLSFLIKLISPTVNYQVGDLSRLPVPDINSSTYNIINFKQSVQNCVDIMKSLVDKDELSWNFVNPTDWTSGLIEALEFEMKLLKYETEISKYCYKLFNVSTKDIKSIEEDFGKLPGDMDNINDIKNKSLEKIEIYYLKKHIPSEVLKQTSEVVNEDDIEDENSENKNNLKISRKILRFLTLEEICLASGFHPDTVCNYIITNKLERPEEKYELAVRWISYAIGILMGRFDYKEVKADDDGICVLDEGHADDLPKNIYNSLEIILNDKKALEIVETINRGTTDNPIEVLRKFLSREFFIDWHLPMYKKRPTYWLLQSKKKNYGFYIYNLKFTNESLYSLIQKYIIPKLQLENAKLKDLIIKRNTSFGTEKRKIETEISRVEDLLDEIEIFKKDIQEVIDTEFKPDIDDGVILNMALIYKLIPSWKEPEKFYKELKEGKYEWSSVSKTLFQKKK
ncbi:MAG: BREX-1 system adenine-specific DNA-methyltransferase PglX [Ignavibacteria bacterium]